MGKAVKCASCHAKLGKRQCPALGALICSVCCGTKREKTIQCPPDCPYLGKAKTTSVEKQLHSLQGHEEEHLDLLQNIEFSISKFYRDTRSITDREVENVMHYLVEQGKRDMGAAAEPLPDLLANEEDLLASIEGILKARQRQVGHDEAQMVKLQCFTRILDSVKLHRSPHQPCNYLNFIGQFLP